MTDSASRDVPRERGGQEELNSLHKIARHLHGAKQRCGPNAKASDKRHYCGIAFEFANAAEGAIALFDKLGPLPPAHSIDRIDPRGPYALHNIRWADAPAQTANRVIASLERKRRLTLPIARVSDNG